MHGKGWERVMNAMFEKRKGENFVRTNLLSNTKGNTIRNMTDEELAEWIYNHDTITAEKGRLSKEEILKLLKSN